MPRLILPEIVAPAYIQEQEKATVTVEQLESMGVDLARMSEEERREIDTIMEESPEGQLVEQQGQLNVSEVEGEEGEKGLINMGLNALESGIQQGISVVQQTLQPQGTQVQPQAMQPFNPFNENNTMMGGLMPPNDPMVYNPATNQMTMGQQMPMGQQMNMGQSK